MGRGKIEIKRIENSSNRQVTYSKRKNGILKKAKEITVLCDAQVSLIIFAASGKMHDYISPSTTLIDILERYHKTSGKRLWDAKHENLNSEIERIKKENDGMQIELRHLKGEDINSLNYKELMGLEEALENGLQSIREKQMEVYRMFRRNDKILEEENRELNFILWLLLKRSGGGKNGIGDDVAAIMMMVVLGLEEQQRVAVMEGAREMDDGFDQGVRDFNSQMPFAFRVQPIQPNLQERM
ncbi:agamous-like MADS-box protein MADS9 isoform X1 [Arachis hypogaea]|uniref:agamous-like MADS-box protein MADS9 isoform X1 n=1 Tax=Arachis hypogaea TaxID=3818 RepID=UPI003B214855